MHRFDLPASVAHRKNQPHLGLLQELPDASLGKIRIDRHDHPAAVENADHPRDEPEPRSAGDGHRFARLQAAGLKIPGKLACRTHQFGIGPAPASVLDRHQVWAFRRPGRHLIGDPYLGRRIQFYPRVGKQVPGLIRHQRVGIDTPVGVLHNLLEQCRKLTPHLHNPLLGKTGRRWQPGSVSARSSLL